MPLKPRVALLRGSLLSPFEMQSYGLLAREFEFTALVPHRTAFDLSGVEVRRRSLWCPLEGGLRFQDTVRNARALQARLGGRGVSYCGMADLLEGFDVCHVMDQYFCYCFEAVAARQRWGTRIVVTQWENIPHLNEGKFFSRQTKRMMRENADLFIAMSEGARRTVREEGVEEGRIIRAFGAVDTGHFKPGHPENSLRTRWGISRGDRLVLSVGRVAADKGFFTLLEAARRLRERRPGIRWLLVGKDECGAEAEVVRAGLAGTVILTGPVPYEDMPRYYRLASLFVLPSRDRRGWQEQFGYVLAEAMACGVPVIGSDSGAIPEVVGDPRRIFPQGDAMALAHLVGRMMTLPPGPLKSAARRRALSCFSAQALSSSLSRAYRAVLSGP